MNIDTKAKSFLSVVMLLVPLMGLTGCLKKKKKAEIKTAEMGRGFDLRGSKKGSKRYGKDLEAFVLDDADEETSVVGANGQKQVAWKEEGAEAQAFEKVFFDFDRFNIRADQADAVKVDVAQGKAAVAEGKMLKVEGHADKHYISELYNLAISQKRAHTMVTALADAGIDKTVLKPVGFGATKPAIDAPGKVQENRRVEIIPLSA